tara:strand:- start:7921 stop:8457 length:537 start_codon:yes stop_codon:yes gene_type:complete
MVQRKRKTTTPKRKSPKRTRRTSPKKKRRTSPRRKIRSKRLNPSPVRGYYNRVRNYFDDGNRQTGSRFQGASRETEAYAAQVDAEVVEQEMEELQREKRKLIVEKIEDRYKYILECFLYENRGLGDDAYLLFHVMMIRRIEKEKDLSSYNEIPNYSVEETYKIKNDALTDLLDDVFYS